MKVVFLIVMIGMVFGLFLIIKDFFISTSKGAKNLYKGTKSTAQDLKRSFEGGTTKGSIEEYHRKKENK